MKKFRFSLEKMLRYQDSLLDEEKNKLAELRAIKNEIDQKIESDENQLAALNDERMEKSARGMSILEMRGYNYSIETVTRLIKALKIEQEKAEVKVQAQLARVLAQQREVSGLERLREKQLEEYQQAAQKEHDLIIAEMVAAKYIRSAAEA